MGIAFAKKIVRFYKTYGLSRCLWRAVELSFGMDNYRRFVRQQRGQDISSIFTHIYENNLWTTAESRSGRGSTISYTGQLRAALPAIVEQLQVQTFVDAPCGDYNWMRLVQFPSSVHYIGVDIVPQMISENERRFGDEAHRFLCTDLTKESVEGDFLFCRDCLFHLCYADILGILKSFNRSEAKFLMTSTHKNLDRFPNVDIYSGGFRVLDLFSEPFNLPQDVAFRIDDYVFPDPPREMCIWTRRQISDAIPEIERKIFGTSGPQRISNDS